MASLIDAQRRAGPGRFRRWLAGRPDDDVLRVLFAGILAVTVGALGYDLAERSGWLPRAATLDAPSPAAEPSSLPSILAPLLPGGDKRLSPLPQRDGALGKPMTFELMNGGRLMATGTITPGIAQAFAAEVGKRADYIKTVVLNSPGGSVADALAMGRLIRENKFATEVEAGKVCASSCPLMFAGGIERRAGDKAAIGVHQVFTLTSDNAVPRDDMGEGQRISAKCQRYLGDMGVNLQVWVHAMETPKDRLFVFKPDELAALNLVTTKPAVAAAPALPPAAPPAPGKSRL